MQLPLHLKRSLSVSRQRQALWPPVVSGDALYHGDQRWLRKYNAGNLEELWKVAAGRVHAVKAVDDVVFVSAHDATERGYQSADGKEIWRLDLGLNWIVWKDRLLVGRGPQIEFVDIRTGQILERLEVGWEAGFRAAWEDTLLLSDAFSLTESSRGPFRLFDMQTRRVIWERDLLGEMRTQFGIGCQFNAVSFVLGTEGRYVATYGGHTFGGSLEDGRILWCSPEDSLYAWPEVHGGRVFMLSSERKDFFVTHFVALDEATGETIYDVSMADHSPPLPKKLGRAQEPLVLEGHLAYATESGCLVALRESDGQPVWHYRHKDELFSGLVAGNRAFVPSADGNILVFEEEGAST